MSFSYKNLVFSGGGVLGIAYLGALRYFYETQIISSIENLAGTSAGAITACLSCFNLPFSELETLLGSLDYSKVPDKDDQDDRIFNNDAEFRSIPKAIKAQLDKIFGNVDCVYRLIKSYGWYSSQYFYTWIQQQIATQFDANKKKPPYTFADFENTSIHIDKRPFKKLFIVGTDISRSISRVFSYDATPNMEVAEAVRISMSVPLLFESISSNLGDPQDTKANLYVDGGMLYNYPIDLFDKDYDLAETLGLYFNSINQSTSLNNIVEFISASLSCTGSVQRTLLAMNPQNLKRSIPIYTSDISSFDFNITTGDETYNFLVEQGYRAAEIYFSLLKS